ncbi:MATE family efflux transporter [Sphingomonas oryzagri]|uniref:MATE family efflux transporter n=1 Tax=Sphingomonas oryzagri TaxID=3042314 RepID=A0ABT6N1Y5_9SPHN|nr:MATE family efflux transporter [Sphingomonas oryzagri]MDH7639300.1 MATE family efflux transporter [Sphingomonas oryzagri]
MILTRRMVITQAWPIILGQSLVPLVGLADATIIGRTGDAAALAGVALGATVINLVFWSFGFLRMGVTGLTAQAWGAGDDDEIVALVARALLIGFGIGVALLLISPLLISPILAILHVPANSLAPARSFTMLRFFGAPAALAFYSINGWLIGLGQTRLALACQLAMNIVNIVCDLVLVAICHLGAAGVGIGTALADWVALFTGICAVRSILRLRPSAGRAWRVRTILSRQALRRLFSVNLDIMVRTVAILALFSWLSRAGARLGTVPLAANHLLMQLVGISAFVLDGFAFTAEQRVGVAIGARSRPALWRAIRLTAEFSLAGAAIFSCLFLVGGRVLVDFVSTAPPVRAEADRMLLYCALVPLVGMPSWLLDGIFIGATRGKALKYAAITALVGYLATDFMMRGAGNDGVWTALLASYIYRAAALALGFPALLRLTSPSIAMDDFSMTGAGQGR